MGRDRKPAWRLAPLLGRAAGCALRASRLAGPFSIGGLWRGREGDEGTESLEAKNTSDAPASQPSGGPLGQRAGDVLAGGPAGGRNAAAYLLPGWAQWSAVLSPGGSWLGGHVLQQPLPQVGTVASAKVAACAKGKQNQPFELNRQKRALPLCVGVGALLATARCATSDTSLVGLFHCRHFPPPGNTARL